MKESQVNRGGVQVFSPGENAQPGQFRKGDFILTHGSGVYATLIRFGQSLRFRGADRLYARWNHAAMIVSDQGNLVEALGAGVLRTHISRYKNTEYHLVELGPLGNPQDREQVTRFAEWTVAERYGWVTIVSIALSLLTGAKFNFGYDSQQICSGLVARALERTTAIFARTPSHIMPADLAKYFQVSPSDPEMPKGRAPGPREDIDGAHDKGGANG